MREDCNKLRFNLFQKQESPPEESRACLYLCNADGEGAGRQQAQKPHQRLREILHEDGEERQAAKHHRQHGSHRAGELGLLKQRSQHEGEEDLWNRVRIWMRGTNVHY